MSGVIHHRQRRQVRISRCFSPIAPSRDCDGLHGFYTLSSVQLSLRSVLTTLTSCFAKPNAVEADLPRHVPSRRVTGEALTETNHTPTFRLSSQGHRRAGSVTDRPLPDMSLTAHTTDSPSEPRPQLRAPYYRSTRPRSETPSINQLLRARTPLVSKPSTPYPRFRGRTEARHKT